MWFANGARPRWRQLGHQDAVQPLVLAMKRDSSKDVRLRAAMALRSLKAAEALRELLSYADPEIRGMAVTGLAKIGDRRIAGGRRRTAA